MSFRKRFNLLAAPMKFEAAAMIGRCLANKTMPTGRLMTNEEYAIMHELCEWCNDNILFDRKPSGDYSEYLNR